jgi:uncharacterized protein YndB with AHSA1/START domain
MGEMRFTILVEAPAEEIFAVIADVAGYATWLPGSKSFGVTTDISPLPVGLGTTYVDAGPAGVRRGEVTAYEPPGRICFHQPMDVAGPLRGTIDIHLCHTLEPTDGATRVGRELTLGIPGALKLATPLIKGMFRKENQRVLAALKAHCEVPETDGAET